MGDLLEVAITPPPSTPATSDAPVTDPSLAAQPEDTSSVTITPPSPDEMPPTQAPPPPAVALPSTDDMQKGLEQSGKLLNDITIDNSPKVDSSPLAALQPHNMLQTADGPQPMHLPSQSQAPLQRIQLGSSTAVKESDPSSLLMTQIVKYVGCGGLFLLSLFSFFTALRFLLVDYGPMERQVFDYVLPESDLQQATIKAAASLLLAVVSSIAVVVILRKASPGLKAGLLGVVLFLLQIYYLTPLSDRYNLYNLMSWL